MNAHETARANSLLKIISRRWIASVDNDDNGAVVVTLADGWYFRTDRAPTRTFATFTAADRGTRKNIVSVQNI